MATWVRTATSGNLSDTQTPTGSFTLGNATAPGDFDPANVTSVRIQYQIQATGLAGDTWTDTRAARLATGQSTGVIAASVNGTDASGLGNTTSTTDETDSSPNTGLTTGQWESMGLWGGAANGLWDWNTYQQDKGPDNGTITVLASSVTVTITYTPTTPSRSATMNGGGSITAAVTHKGAAAPTINGGGSFTTTVVRGTFSTSVVELAFTGSAPYVDRAGLYIRWRVSSASLAGVGSNLVWSLEEGATQRASGNVPDVASTSFQTTLITISEAAAATVTSWANVSVTISVSKTEGSGAGFAEIADVWLAIPASAGNPEAAATMNGGGSIAPTFAKTAERAETINGGGSITAADTKNAETAPTLNGGGSITAAVTATETHTTTAAMNGGGSIAATADTARSVAVAVNGGGSFAVNFNTKMERAGTIRGGGSITPTVASARDTAPTVNGGGSIAATTVATEAHSTTAEMNGGGSIAATTTATETHSTTATANGGGSITPTVTGSHDAADSVNGGGSITATPESARSVAVTMNGGGRLLPGTGGAVNTSGIMNGGGSIAATTESARAAAPTINGGGSIAATTDATEAHSTTASLNGGGSITAVTDATEAHATSGAVNGGGSIAPAVTGGHATTATANGGGSITATATGTEAGQAAAEMNGGGSITPAVTHAGSVAATANGGGSNAATAVKSAVAAVTANGGGSLTVSFLPSRSSAAVANGGGSITAAVTKNEGGGGIPTSGEMNGGGSIAASVTKRLAVMLHLSAVPDPGPATVEMFFKVKNETGVTQIVWFDFFTDTGYKFSRNAGVSGSSPGLVLAGYDYIPKPLVDLIDNWSEVRVQIRATPVKVMDFRWTVLPPSVIDSINGGGSITATVTTGHQTRAFPNLAEGLVGPAANSGGSITFEGYPGYVGSTYGVMNGGGSITAAVSRPTEKSTSATMRGGGSITTAEDAKRIVNFGEFNSVDWDLFFSVGIAATGGDQTNPLNDGDLGTWIRSDNGSNWWFFDMGKPVKLNQISLYQNNFRAAGSLYYCDNPDWTNINNYTQGGTTWGTPGTNDWYDYAVDDGAHRYWAINQFNKMELADVIFRGEGVSFQTGGRIIPSTAEVAVQATMRGGGGVRPLHRQIIRPTADLPGIGTAWEDTSGGNGNGQFWDDVDDDSTADFLRLQLSSPNEFSSLIFDLPPVEWLSGDTQIEVLIKGIAFIDISDTKPRLTLYLMTDNGGTTLKQGSAGGGLNSFAWTSLPITAEEMSQIEDLSDLQIGVLVQNRALAGANTVDLAAVKFTSDAGVVHKGRKFEVMNGGGGVTASIDSQYWLDFGRTPGRGLTDDGAGKGYTDDGTDIGYTDDGTEPGEIDRDVDLGTSDP